MYTVIPRLKSPRLTSFRAYVFCSRIQYIKTSAHICRPTYDAEDLIGIRKQMALDETAEELKAEPKETTRPALNLTEGL
jgi:hypothetical protein